MGVILSTQDPADLDDKGLGNIGAWFVGVLRTDRDEARVLEGMGGRHRRGRDDAGDGGNRIESSQATHLPDADAQEGRLRSFFSRWMMSYLRGPLTVAEVQQLTVLPTAPKVADVDFSTQTTPAVSANNLPPNHPTT